VGPGQPWFSCWNKALLVGLENTRQSYYLNCTKFGKLILRKIINIVATRCLISKLKCIIFDFSWGSASDPDGGAHSAPPNPLIGLQVPTSKGKEGRRSGSTEPGPNFSLVYATPLFDNIKLSIFCSFGLKTPTDGPKIGVFGRVSPPKRGT